MAAFATTNQSCTANSSTSSTTPASSTSSPAPGSGCTDHTQRAPHPGWRAQTKSGGHPMATIINTRLGEHRGHKRLWLEGQKLAREGYRPGMKLDMEIQGTQV